MTADAPRTLRDEAQWWFEEFVEPWKADDADGYERAKERLAALAAATPEPSTLRELAQEYVSMYQAHKNCECLACRFRAALAAATPDASIHATLKYAGKLKPLPYNEDAAATPASTPDNTPCSCPDCLFLYGKPAAQRDRQGQG